MDTKRSYRPFRKTVTAVSLALIMVMLSSCNLPSMPAATATPLASATPMPPQDTPTALPPTATATQSASPTASTTPAAINIVFGAGMTTTEQDGNIQPKQVQTYTLSAGQNQAMMLAVNSNVGDVTLGVTEADGTVLLDPAKKWIDWQWILPKTEVYTISIYGGASAETYALTAKVAQIVNFPAGTTSVTLPGSTPSGDVVAYSLACKVNQMLSASLNVPNTTAYIDIFGIATGTLLSPNGHATSFNGTLASTQNYIIEVIPAHGQVVNYTLTVGVK